MGTTVHAQVVHFLQHTKVVHKDGHSQITHVVYSLHMAVTKTRTGLEMDWRWTGAFLILNTSEQPFLTFNIYYRSSLFTGATQLELACITGW